MHIYVHIPFCARRCPYCGFYSSEQGALSRSYFDALREEIFMQPVVPSAGYGEDEDTVYFGGGTPSYVDADLICGAFLDIRRKFSLGSGEFTIEVNPNSLTLKKARAYFDAGFNRISIGVQSLHDDVLKTLGRLHDQRQATEAIRTARLAGFENISCDLMLGVPGQDLKGLYEDASFLVREGAKHISMYSLTIEENTPFEDLYKGGIELYVDPDLEREMYHGLRDYLEQMGLEAYEISNCAFKGFRSRHNSSYWLGREYYAFGAGAHGYLDSVRFSHEDLSSYLRSPSSRITEEILNEDQKRAEKCMLGLRTREGISFAMAAGFDEVIKKHIDDGLLEKTEAGYRLSRRGLDLGNLVFMDFL